MKGPIRILLVLLVAAAAAAFLLPMQPKAVPVQEEAKSKIELEKTKIRIEVFRVAGAEIADSHWELEPEEFWTQLLEGAGQRVNGFLDPMSLEEAQARLRDMGEKADICKFHVVFPEHEKSQWIDVTCP